MERLSFVGLGKLGLCMAACFAVKGYEVIGIDIDENVVGSINNGQSPVVEPGLPELIMRAGKNLRATKDHEEAIGKTDITFIMVSTPSNPDGTFSNRYVEAALKSLAEALGRSSKEYHLFVINCTVMPTSTEEGFIPLIERYSGRKLGTGFGVCYDPDFAALGNVINGFLKPDFVIVGESSPSAGDRVAAIHRKICPNRPPIFQMSLIDAEIAKVALNCYITTKISFANALANLCQRIPGTNVDAITQAIGTDRRISPHCLRGGLSYGGTCFPRDTAAYKALARKYGYQDELMPAVERVNDFQDRRLLEVTLDSIPAAGNRRVSILGLAFKPDTPVIEASPAIRLIDGLLERGVAVTAYDPLAMENTRAVFGDRISYASSVKDCLSQSNVCVVTTMSDEFQQIDDSYIANNPTTIIDCWRMLEPLRFARGVKYVPWGRADSAAPGPARIGEAT